MQNRFYKICIFTLAAILTLACAIPAPAPVCADTPAPGDFITFGRYEQDNDTGNGPEPIEWRVLAVENGRMLVMSRFILDIAPYHNKYSTEGITWADCSLRAFLNDEFYQSAFNDAEKRAVLLTDVQNDDNPAGTEGGVNTQDYVFAPSANEMHQYTDYNCIYDEKGGEWIHPDRMAYYTPYAEAKGGTKWEGYDTGFYWLRTPGKIPTEAANISCHGYGLAVDLSYTSSHYVTCATYGVRPAMMLSLSEFASSGVASPTDPAHTPVTPSAGNDPTGTDSAGNNPSGTGSGEASPSAGAVTPSGGGQAAPSGSPTVGSAAGSATKKPPASRTAVVIAAVALALIILVVCQHLIRTRRRG